MAKLVYGNMTIAFLFPHPAAGPTGGYKVVYEYANRLATEGWRVEIVYSGSIYFRQKSLWHKLTNIVRQLQGHLMGYSGRKWFPLAKEVRERLTLSLNYRHVPRTELYVATSPYTAYYLNRYPIDSSRKFYFIQGYEDWGPGLKSILEETYHYKMRKMVVATWLQRMLKERYGEESELLPNGFDFQKFRLTVPIAEKSPLRVSMLYHTMERKDCAMGFRALEQVKRRYPELRVGLFGVPERPAALPEWYDYHCQPTAEEHNRLNNEAAIYIGTSRTEGWGLTVGEAMICGQAVCCTDIAGYREMAIDGDTALLSPPGDADAMAQNILRLISDDKLRRRIAERGYDYIQHFRWEESYRKLCSLFNEITSGQKNSCEKSVILPPPSKLLAA